eukprot:gene30315-37873_t
MERTEGARGIGTYDVNVVHAVAEQTAGIIPHKMEQALTALGLDYSLNKRTHRYHQCMVGEAAESICLESCLETLKEEVRLTMEDGK